MSKRWVGALVILYVIAACATGHTGRGSQVAPFAGYLNRVHSRIHPIFVDMFIASLNSLPDSNPMNRPDMYASLEIVLDRQQGRIQRMGVTRTSGVVAFDVAALESVYRAQPFGPPPRDIVSPDGNVYLHWEFHRGVEACGTANAHPFMLRVPPQSMPLPIMPSATARAEAKGFVPPLGEPTPPPVKP